MRVRLRTFTDCLALPTRSYLGCVAAGCQLCKHNPNKACAPEQLFDEAYADRQVLAGRCGAELWVELLDASTGQVLTQASGIEVQVRVGVGLAAGRVDASAGACVWVHECTDLELR
jgi:hypothetical protein